MKNIHIKNIILSAIVILLLIIVIIKIVDRDILYKYKNIDNYKVSKIIWDYLEYKKIKTVFGLPGGFITKLLYNIPQDIKWINTGNELTNGFIAQVYGQYENNVGILFVTSGPGIASALSAISNAYHENNPLLVITGHNNKYKSENDFQNIDINGFNGVTPHIFIINDTSLILSTFDKAFSMAKDKNTGVIITIDISLYDQIPMYINYNKDQYNEVSVHSIQHQLSNYLNNKDNILVILGKGNFIYENKVIQFLNNNQLPYVTTWKGRGYNKGIYCGRIGTLGNHSGNYALYHAKYLLIIGNLSGGLTLNSLFYINKFSIPISDNKSIATLSITEESVYYKSDKQFIVDNIENVLDGLKINTNDSWKNQLRHANKILLVPLNRYSELEKYCFIASKIYNDNKLDIAVTTGVGNHWYAIGKYFDFASMNRWHSPTIWASIGVGITNGYGMYLSQKKPVWIFEGDGGALFSSNMILYLLNNKDIPLTITFFIDNYYSAVVSGYIINNYIHDKNTDTSTNYMNTNKVSKIDWVKILPQDITFVFDNENDYYQYLKNNPISLKLRFILLKISNYSESNIYEINYDKTYTTDLKNNNFDGILNSKLVIKSDEA